MGEGMTVNSPHKVSEDLFPDIPDNCEGCGAPEVQDIPRNPYGWGTPDYRSFIKWMPLVSAYLCTTCLREYTAWDELSSRHTSPEEHQNFKPGWLTQLEARRK